MPPVLSKADQVTTLTKELASNNDGLMKQIMNDLKEDHAMSQETRDRLVAMLQDIQKKTEMYKWIYLHDQRAALTKLNNGWFRNNIAQVTKEIDHITTVYKANIDQVRKEYESFASEATMCSKNLEKKWKGLLIGAIALGAAAVVIGALVALHCTCCLLLPVEIIAIIATAGIVFVSGGCTLAGFAAKFRRLMKSVKKIAGRKKKRSPMEQAVIAHSGNATKVDTNMLDNEDAVRRMLLEIETDIQRLDKKLLQESIGNFTGDVRETYDSYFQEDFPEA